MGTSEPICGWNSDGRTSNVHTNTSSCAQACTQFVVGHLSFNRRSIHWRAAPRPDQGTKREALHNRALAFSHTSRECPSTTIQSSCLEAHGALHAIATVAPVRVHAATSLLARHPLLFHRLALEQVRVPGLGNFALGALIPRCPGPRRNRRRTLSKANIAASWAHLTLVATAWAQESSANSFSARSPSAGLASSLRDQAPCRHHSRTASGPRSAPAPHVLYASAERRGRRGANPPQR